MSTLTDPKFISSWRKTHRPNSENTEGGDVQRDRAKIDRIWDEIQADPNRLGWKAPTNQEQENEHI